MAAGGGTGAGALPRFGTDGVRGVANVELTPEYVLALGRAAGRRLGGRRIVVGRDTRASGPLLEAALCAGLASEGTDVELLGVCPTPVVAWAAAHEGWAGAMISASHNPFPDNGIKLFAPGGLKLSDDAQAAVEAEVAVVYGGGSPDDRSARAGSRPSGAAVGRVAGAPDLLAGYARALRDALEGRRLDGLSVVIDCANGAASASAPVALAELGADVTVLHDRPDGTNINERCGSTDLGDLAAAVTGSGADLGLAFDGDADRVLAVDHRGVTVDGDELIGMCAVDLKARGLLVDDTVVVTVMANQGFRLGMRRAGIAVQETSVGDRYVLAALESGGWVLGGEQSGHVIFRRLATTGDGLLTGVLVADLVRRSGRSLADLAAATMHRLPQVLVNVPLAGGGASQVDGVLERIRPVVADVEARLGEEGRVLIRPSGTEPLIRVMVEAAEADTAGSLVDELVDAVRREAGRGADPATDRGGPRATGRAGGDGADPAPPIARAS